MKFILASGSPRRREILKNAGYDFEVMTADADETLPQDIAPEDAVLYLAQLKGDAAAEKTGLTVVSADTVVALSGKILGKPKDEADAANMLAALSGKTHSVFTGVCIQNAEKKVKFCEQTLVEFYSLSEKEISDYVLTKEPMDKAGAYGIQGLGALLVKRINGDYLNVVGLPLARLSRELAKFGIKRRINKNEII